MTHLWHDIPTGPLKKLNIIIEIPAGSKVKYELDKRKGVIKVDRILPSSVAYPGNYGFVPQTLSDDSDPLDAMVISQGSFPPGVLIECRPIGVIYALDGGKKDYKLLCVPITDPHYKKIKDVKDLSNDKKLEIEEFFKIYKRLEKKKIIVKSTRGRKNAEIIINRAINKYKNATFNKN